ncbi:hypothetical protein [Microvirga sp. KLBC 81]|uniref:hypothetical protein n=1 Tax=Microvirga sp. KLBC 81 TaxID=1862707 RepID=UPI001FDFEE31|nr:hypothetical protein [Microvirga sp. KLBC 81]
MGKKPDEPLPLYPTEDQIARAVLPPDNVKSWDGIAAVLEKRGFPQIDPLFGGRYWPAVKAFLDRRHGLTDATPAQDLEELENWNAPKSGPRAARSRS